jgi:hypothetical protein
MSVGGLLALSQSRRLEWVFYEPDSVVAVVRVDEPAR